MNRTVSPASQAFKAGPRVSAGTRAGLFYAHWRQPIGKISVKRMLRIGQFLRL